MAEGWVSITGGKPLLVDQYSWRSTANTFIKIFAISPFWISLLTGLLFFNNILKYHILNDFNAGLLHVLILMNIFAFFLLKYKRYELKISQKEWQEICYRLWK